MLFKLAWRNLWRNKRRTAITVSSIFFAVITALFTRAFQLGAYNYMLDNIVKRFSGHLQIQNKSYLHNPSVENLLPYSDSLKQILKSSKKIVAFVPRLQSPVMCFWNDSKLGLVIGTDLNKEKNFSTFQTNIVRYVIDSSLVVKLERQTRTSFPYTELTGYYNSENDLKKAILNIDTNLLSVFDLIKKEALIDTIALSSADTGCIVIGSGLARILNRTTGDSLILMSSTYEGGSGFGKYCIKNIVKYPNDEFNSNIIYMNLFDAVTLFDAYDGTDTMVSYIALNTIYKASLQKKDYKNIFSVQQILKKRLGKEVRILGWKKINKNIEQQIESDNAGGKLMLFVIYLVIGFGVFGTVMMMFNERKREFAVLLAIGVKKMKLLISFFTELILMSFIGVILAEITAIPVLYYFHLNPIHLGGEMAKAFTPYNIEPVIPTAWCGDFLWSQALIVLLIVFLVMFYPIFKFKKMKYSEMIRK